MEIKTPTKVTVVVKLINKIYEVQMKPDVLEYYEDVRLEACTRLLENNIKHKEYNVGPFMEARIKDEEDVHLYNTYKVLINGAYHKYAENLRHMFKQQHNIDLNDEPIKASKPWKTKIKN